MCRIVLHCEASCEHVGEDSNLCASRGAIDARLSPL